MFIDCGNNDNVAHVAYGNGETEPFLLTADPARGRVGFSNEEIPQNSVAFGSGQTLNGTSSVTIGFGASTNSEAVAIGHGAEATGESSIAIGGLTNGEWYNNSSYARATNLNALAIQGTASGNSSVAIGPETVAAGEMATAVGSGATEARGTQSIAIGFGGIVEASAARSVAIGGRAKGTNSIVITGNTWEGADHSIAIGSFAQTYGEESIAIGYGANAKAERAIAIGRHWASGKNTTASAQDAIAIGSGEATGSGAIAIGDAEASGYASTAVGSSVTVAEGRNSGKSPAGRRTGHRRRNPGHAGQRAAVRQNAVLRGVPGYRAAGVCRRPGD